MVCRTSLHLTTFFDTHSHVPTIDRSLICFSLQFARSSRSFRVMK
jgi:hypothetical protein